MRNERGHVRASATITMQTAHDTDGTITKVDFYADGGIVGTDSSFPYSFD